MPLRSDIKKVLVIGSGPIIIGQAAEFDYAGTQACRALKQEGLEVVLINSNPATIMTDKAMADKVYIEPLTLDVVKRIIRIEKPDSLLSTMGGQTGLTLSMQLAEEGFLEANGVKLLGADPQTIHKAEDRQAFKDTMEKINQPCIPSKVVETIEDAVDFAKIIGYPVIVRPAFTLGGTGGGIADNEEMLRDITKNGLLLSPITQVLIEKCISGWKEIEFEVIRDRKGNVITVCQIPDQVHVVRLGRNEIPQRIEHKALRTVRTGQIFHCLCHMRVGADNHIAAPVNDFLCQCLYAVGNVVGILHAPVTGHHYHVRNFLGCGDLLQLLHGKSLLNDKSAGKIHRFCSHTGKVINGSADGKLADISPRKKCRRNNKSIGGYCHFSCRRNQHGRIIGCEIRVCKMRFEYFIDQF